MSVSGGRSGLVIACSVGDRSRFMSVSGGRSGLVITRSVRDRSDLRTTHRNRCAETFCGDVV